MSDIHVASLSHEAVMNEYPQLVQREVDLENEAADIAKELIAKAIQSRGMVDSSPTARKSILSCVKSTAELIDQWIDEQSLVRRKSTVLQHISVLSSEQLAYIVSRELLNNATAGHTGYTNICSRVGESVRRVVEYALFEEANAGLAAKLESQLKTSSSPRHQQSVFRAAMRSADFEGLKWDVEQKASVGFIMVNAFNDATGLFEKIATTIANRTHTRLSPTATMGLLLAEADIFDSLLMPYHYPMIVPPRPWQDIHDGGYLNQKQHPLNMVKAKTGSHMAQLEATDLDDVADAINAIQATPWRINLDVLEVMQALHADGNGEAKLASSNEVELPAKPWPEMDKEQWAAWKLEEGNAEILKAWKLEAKEAYHARTQWASKRLVQQQQLKLAARFAEEPAIYFPHTVDFRGRIYPAAGLGAINPQGNDAGKAMLEFARGKAVGTTGGRWLAIHAANVWGYDKVSLDDREMWSLLNSERMQDVAADPLADLWWTKADKPFCFLAACFEWTGYCLQGEEFVSHLPIAMDGSCSGLQHYGAMLRDQRTAEAVNVVSSGPVPADVYTVVLDRVVERLEASGAPLAVEWLSRLKRLIVKQPVMTTPYGVTARGIVDQIAANTKRLINDGVIEAFEGRFYDAAKFLAPLVIDAIGVEVAAAGKAMDWLKSVARITGKAGQPVRWETPIGFTAIQDYRKSNGRRLKVSWAGQQQQLTIQKSGSTLDAGRQASGLAPNFVHSMDACHLMITVNNCVDYGVEDFAMIHDSFAVHAADTGLLNEVIRECFITMYSGNMLEDFYLQLSDQLPPEVWAKLPPPPSQGTLDLEGVRSSVYFFA